MRLTYEVSFLAGVLWLAPGMAAQSSYSDFQAAFSQATSTTFGPEAAAPIKTKAVFVTKPYTAYLVQKVFNQSGASISISTKDEPFPLSSQPLTVNTSDLDCSVNAYCGSCSGGGLGRAWCESKRAGCAAFNSPRMAACTVEKDANGLELADVSFSGEDLSLGAQATGLTLTLDPSLSTITMQASVSAQATVENTTAHVSVLPESPILHFLVGCPINPTVNVPPIGLALNNTSLPISATVAVAADAPAAADSVDVTVTINQIDLDLDVNTGNIFSWVIHNPGAILSCTLPSIASFTYLTTVQHHDVKASKGPIDYRTAEISLTRDGATLHFMPIINSVALGAIEVQQ